MGILINWMCFLLGVGLTASIGYLIWLTRRYRARCIDEIMKLICTDLAELSRLPYTVREMEYCASDAVEDGLIYPIRPLSIYEQMETVRLAAKLWERASRRGEDFSGDSKHHTVRYLDSALRNNP